MTRTLPGLDIPPTARKRRRVRCPATPSGRAKKGGRIEREIVALHVEIGIPARRVPFSGSLASRAGAEFAGDVKVWALGADAPPLTAEVKARAAGAGFTTLERWLGGFDVLVLKRNNAPPLVALPWRTWAMLLTRGRT
jgi:hypothetical protein